MRDRERRTHNFIHGLSSRRRFRKCRCKREDVIAESRARKHAKKKNKNEMKRTQDEENTRKIKRIETRQNNRNKKKTNRNKKKKNFKDGNVRKNQRIMDRQEQRRNRKQGYSSKRRNKCKC